MNIEKDVIGTSFLCDTLGRVTKFLRDDIGLSGRLKPGQPFTLALETESMSKGFKFFNEVKTQGTAFDWELCAVVDNQIQILYFAGYAGSAWVFIVGSKTRGGVIEFCDELMVINNEQATAVRTLMKEQISGTKDQTEQEKKYYEELTRLNNELESIQRQLEKKNIALGRANTQLEEQKKELERLNSELSATIDELERTRDELVQSEKMASLGRLVSGFAHEINTPIGIAVTASSSLSDAQQSIMGMLSQEEVDEDDLVSNLETIRDASELTLANLRRAAELLISFKRTSIDQTAETPRLFGVYEVIHDVVVSLNNKFKQTQIEIKITCPSDLSIYGYPGSISQILTNFMMNSLIYGFEDGSLPGEIVMSAGQENDNLCLEYADSGKGMDEETLKNLFEPFFTTRRARGGTGLGMYICYNIITSRLKGTIECESEPGQGTRFHIRFPVEKLGGER